MVIKSYAKINLSLNVSKRLNNGLHEIQSLFCLVNLFDEISIKKQKGHFKKIKSILAANLQRYKIFKQLNSKGFKYTSKKEVNFKLLLH